MEHKIKISYSTGQQEETDSCPFWKVGGGLKLEKYCGHPIKKRKMKCEYGMTDVRVPRRCPLRNGSTIKTIELLVIN